MNSSDAYCTYNKKHNKEARKCRTEANGRKMHGHLIFSYQRLRIFHSAVKKGITQTKWLSGGAEQRETKTQWQTTGGNQWAGPGFQITQMGFSQMFLCLLFLIQICTFVLIFGNN